jgi:outer membrane usher protein
MLAMLIRKLFWISRKLVAASFIGGISISSFADVVENVIPPISDRPTRQMPSASSVPALASSLKFSEQLVQVDVNQQEINETVLILEDQNGEIYVWGHDLKRWRLCPPPVQTSVDYHGEKYYPLSAICDLTPIYDPKALTLKIEASPDSFVKTVIVEHNSPNPVPVRTVAGGFFNYDLFASYSPDSMQHSAQLEMGYFNRFGVGTNNMLVDQFAQHPRVTRLDTTWTVDYPKVQKSLRMGDVINVPGTWGRSLRIGGIQFGTNFGTQPNFNTFPSQVANGQAVLPSTVDVFVNNALVSSQSVAPGPFAIKNLPIVTGAGEVELVVRDMFGREQRVTQPFYYSQDLLRQGLEDFSYELGMVRENFGINSNDYGSWIGIGTYRRGISDHFTGEVHAESMRNQTTIGTGGDYLLPQLGTFNAYLAGSISNVDNGVMGLLGFNRQAYPWSFGARTQWFSSGFTQAGMQAPQLPPVQMSSFNLSYASLAGGSVGIAYVGQHNRDQANTSIATISYSLSLGKIGSLNLSALHNLTGDMSTSVFAMLSIPLSSATNLSFSAQSTQGGSSGSSSEFTTNLQRNLPAGVGYGYRLQASANGNREAAYSLQNNVGTYTVEAAQSQGTTAARLNVSGGVAVLGGDMFLSRRINQSFAVARIKDYPNVHVLADNQPAGLTDAHGNALIPRLRAYDRNVIRIDQRDLPLDVEIGTLKLDAVPYLRSGVEIIFPVKHSRGATLTIHLDDGNAMPVGALVEVVGRDETYTVGYEGQVYISDFDPTTRLSAAWNGKSCEFDVRFTLSDDPLQDLGIFICKGVDP